MSLGYVPALRFMRSGSPRLHLLQLFQRMHGKAHDGRRSDQVIWRMDKKLGDPDSNLLVSEALRKSIHRNKRGGIPLPVQHMEANGAVVFLN